MNKPKKNQALINALIKQGWAAELAASKLWQDSPTMKNFRLWKMATDFAIKLQKQLTK